MNVNLTLINVKILYYIHSQSGLNNDQSTMCKLATESTIIYLGSFI